LYICHFVFYDENPAVIGALTICLVVRFRPHRKQTLHVSVAI
jgi:hypothetical protein